MPEAGVAETELFVYYRVPEAACMPVAAVVAAMHRELVAEWPGLQARVLRRPDARDGQATLMETYARPGPGIDAALHEAIDRAAVRALTGFGAGPRHTEVFLPCA